MDSDAAPALLVWDETLSSNNPSAFERAIASSSIRFPVSHHVTSHHTSSTSSCSARSAESAGNTCPPAGWASILAASDVTSHSNRRKATRRAAKARRRRTPTRRGSYLSPGAYVDAHPEAVLARLVVALDGFLYGTGEFLTSRSVRAALPIDDPPGLQSQFPHVTRPSNGNTGHSCVVRVVFFACWLHITFLFFAVARHMRQRPQLLSECLVGFSVDDADRCWHNRVALALSRFGPEWLG
ncbi:hypothetical protein C8F01DRAFT_1185879 [Mycena amicta]|nr:hypothetical protein C8F01DRAFT_1185879 [Mycena amicta]